MTENDPAYLEGDTIENRFNPRLFRLLAAFLRPHRRLVIIASGLILLSIALELAMPFITRTAIDSYLVPYFLSIDSKHLLPELRRKLTDSLPDKELIKEAENLYLSERQWRKLDPALAARLRQSGAMDLKRWYCIETKRGLTQLVTRYPELFIRTDGQVLIAEEHLKRLTGPDLRQLRISDAHGLIMMAALFCLAALSILAVSYFQAVYLEQAGQMMMMDLRLHLYRHILSRSLLFFGNHPVGKLVTRINNDVQNISELFRNMLVGLFKDIFLFTGIAVVMFALNARLAAVCMLVVPLMSLTTSFFARISKGLFRRLQGYTGKMNTMFQETLAGITTVKLLGAESTILSKLLHLNGCHFRVGLAQTGIFAVFTPLMELLASLAVALTLWYGGASVIQDRISLGTLVAFLTYMQMILVPIRDLSEKYNQLQGAMTSTERILTVLDDTEALSTYQVDQQHQLPKDADIIFQSVSFAYQPDQSIFEHFNLTIPKGQTITLVGPSGSGKSTLVNLLLRLYDPQKGAIFLGGRDLKSISPQNLVEHISLVSQEIILLAAGVKDNITLGREYITPEMLANAVKISGVATWLDDLGEGIHTRIGEGGRQLSRGQLQMLSLARALAGDPRILILDETFSQIDPETEQMIASGLPSIMAGRTCISVAHRLSTARYSERILVLRNGHIIEDGNHQALIAANGIYADMVKLNELNT